jgi:MFS transporter, ACS family, DAL5 transporter family protein
VDLYLIRWLAVRENRRRDKAREEKGESYIVEKNHEFLDLTDRENEEFRYSL